MTTPKLSVIRGAKRELRAPGRAPTDVPFASSAEAEPVGTAESELVISLLDGWVRVLERQARSIKP